MTAPAPDCRCASCFAETDGRVPCPDCGFDPRAPAERHPLLLPLGARVGKFVIGRVLGKPGGFGITYLAWDSGLHRRVAIKEYLPRNWAARARDGERVLPHGDDDALLFADFLDRFRTEAQTLAHLDAHPGIVRVHDVLDANGTAYLVMQYYPGLTLDEYLNAADGRLTEAQVLTLIGPVLDGLAWVHAHGLFHRDIKPQNIYLAEAGPGRVRPLLIDFGAARPATGDRSVVQSALIYTDGFAAPEQGVLKTRMDARTDLYAVGAVLWRCLSGQVPPPADARLRGTPLPPASAFGALAQVSDAIEQAMALRPEQRPADVAALRALLLAAEPVVPGDPPPRPAIRPIERATDPPDAPGPLTGAPVEPDGAIRLDLPRRTPPRTGDARRWQRPGVGALAVLGLLLLVGAGLAAAPGLWQGWQDWRARTEAEAEAEAAEQARREAAAKAAEEAERRAAESRAAEEARRREAEAQAAEQARRQAEAQAADEARRREAEDIRALAPGQPPITPDGGTTPGRFVKLGDAGEPLPDDAPAWACVQDTITGLIWEIKTADGGLLDQNHTYTWYDPDPRTNGGHPGIQGGGTCGGDARCDTAGYAAAVNRVGLCGSADWRLPSPEELRSIVDYSRHDPAIDPDWFPNTPSDPNTRLEGFWSASAAYRVPDPDPGLALAWCLYSETGVISFRHRLYAERVRLVRGGQ